MFESPPRMFMLGIDQRPPNAFDALREFVARLGLSVTLVPKNGIRLVDGVLEVDQLVEDEDGQRVATDAGPLVCTFRYDGRPSSPQGGDVDARS